MDDLISRRRLLRDTYFQEDRYPESHLLRMAINEQPTVNPLPCKIGDTVWTTKNYWGTIHIKSGVVSEMFYLDDMRLAIVVKDTRRGFWGKDIFATYEECAAEMERRRGRQ